MRMSSDVVNRLSDASKNYDWGYVRVGQMCVSMGAMLSKSRVGGWSQQTRQQQVFNEFDAGSYDRGELDFRLRDRPLVPETPMEKAQAAAARENLKTPQALREVDYTDKEIYGVDPATGEANVPETQDGILAEQERVALTQQNRFNFGFAGA